MLFLFYPSHRDWKEMNPERPKLGRAMKGLHSAPRPLLVNIARAGGVKEYKLRAER